jgi:hypothetical protein
VQFATPSSPASSPVWLGRLNAGLVLLLAAALALPLGALAGLSGEFALILGVVIAVASAILLNQRIGVWWLCLLFPLSQLTILPRQMLGITGFTPINVLLLATLTALAAAYVAQWLKGTGAARLPVPPQLSLLYVLPITLAALHGLLSIDLIPEYYRTGVGAISFDSAPSYLRDVLIRPMFLVIFAVLVAVAFRDAPNPKRYLAASLFAALVIASLVFYVVVASGASLALLATPQGRSVLSGLNMHANEFSLLLNSALALVLFVIPAERGLRRLALLACAAVLVAAVLATFSRGGFLGLALIYIAFLLHVRDARWLLFSLFAATFVLLVAPGAVFERALQGIAANDHGAISAGRLDQIWPLLWPVVLDHMAVGNGLMSILWSEPARTGWLQVAQPHNAYLALLLDMGLVGFVWIMAFFFWAIRNALAASREAGAAGDMFHRQFFLGAMVTTLLLFVQGISDDRFTPTVPQSFMWLTIGASIGYRARLRLAATAGSTAARAAAEAVDEAPRRRPRSAGGYLSVRRTTVAAAEGHRA